MIMEMMHYEMEQKENIVELHKEILDICERKRLVILNEFLNYADKNKDQLKGALISNYENLFKVISSIDYFLC